MVEVGVAHALLERLVAQVADVVVEDGVVRAACDEIVGAEIAAQQGVAEVGGIVLLPAPVAPRVEGRVEVDMAVAELISAFILTAYFSRTAFQSTPFSSKKQ